MSASLAVSWLSLQLCGFGVVSPPPSAMLFSKGFPVKVGRGCGTLSSGASFIPNFQRLATKVHQLPALGSWPTAAALHAGPLLCLPALSRLIPVGPSPSAYSQKAGGDNCVLSAVMGKSGGSSEAALSSPAKRTGKASEKGVV